MSENIDCDAEEKPFPFVINGQYTPFIALKIFGMVDKESLLNCRAVSTDWRNLIDLHTLLWRNMNQNHYHEAARCGRLDICQLFIHRAQDKNPRGKHGLTPLHQAARHGHLEICRLILHMVDDTNPVDEYGVTPLHWAAS